MIVFSDSSITLHHGHALEVLRELDDAVADCVVTSPPYFGHRDYGTPAQYGQEASPAEYVEHLVELLAEVRRVLVDDGTLNGMPESVADRVSTRHEHVFLLTKWFDLEPLLERASGRKSGNHVATAEAYREALGGDQGSGSRFGGNPGSTLHTKHHETRNPGDVWSIPTVPFAEAHFATMPPVLAERCVLAGCKPGGVVLDPFSGSGTSGMAATKHGRRFIGIDANRDYLELSLRTRLSQSTIEEATA